MNSNKQSVGCLGLVALPFILVAGLINAPRPTLILIAVIVGVVVWRAWGQRWWTLWQLQKRKEQRQQELRRLR